MGRDEDSEEMIGDGRSILRGSVSRASPIVMVVFLLACLNKQNAMMSCI